MNLLLDTHLLLWAASDSSRLPSAAREMITQEDNRLIFSLASLWKIPTKRSLSRSGFRADPRLLRRGLVDNDYEELPITSEHAVSVEGLPALHKDPFEGILVAQATVEGCTLVTCDDQFAQYPGPVRRV
jgi:PIN domain nuclease of toxin-antitoxin system